MKIQWFIPFKDIGLQTRALLLSTLPVLLIGTLLACLFLQQRFSELDKLQSDQGEMIAAAFSHSIFESMTQHQGQTLPFYAQRILEESSVRSVAIYDPAGALLAQAGPRMHALPKGMALIPSDHNNDAISRKTEATLRVIHPIYPASSYHPLATGQTATGWLEVEIDRSNLILERYRSMLHMLVVMILALILNGATALHFSTTIGRTLSRIRNALTTMTAGQLETRIEETAWGELRDLQVALNRLATSILEGHQELQQNVDQTTEDLRETLETIEIQNIELDLARKEALEASRIKSEFLANMSHEIRTPLNGIIGFTNLLLKSEITVAQRDYLDTIQKSSESLLAIINDILDFSKIEAGKLVLDQAPLNLQEVVEDVLNLLAPLAYEKHLEQVSLFYSDVPTGIIGDSLRLRQILTNLVNNAIKFTDHGEVVVRVMLDDLRDNQATIKITVTDTGIGLSKEQQRTLFNAFRQADPTTARRFGGTGLGLVISKHLVEQMRGNIGLESEAGQGATFWFTFRAEVHNLESPDQPLMIGQHCQIAIYDSNPILRNNLKNCLHRRQAEVEEYADIHELAARLQSETPAPFHAVIIGINAQHPLYGDIAQLIKNNPHHVPVIIHANPADHHTLCSLLNNDRLPLIAKPLSQQKAYEVLGNIVDTDAFTPPSRQAGKFLRSRCYNDQRPLRVLAVDDNAANLKLLNVLLEDLKVQVTACDSGIHALHQAEQREFDLVLMDIQMPVMDGIETARRIRMLEKGGQHTPIIAVTAHALASEKHNLLNAGMDDYVTKPINESQLIHIIHKWTGVDLDPLGLPVKNSHPAQAIITPSAVDMAAGIRLANGKAELAEELLQMLVTSLQADKPRIQQLLAQQDHHNLLETVHKLHGATRYTGVPRLQVLSQTLEETLKLKQYAQLESDCQALLDEIERILDWYQENRSAADLPY